MQVRYLYFNQSNTIHLTIAGLILKYSSISPLAARLLDALSWNSVLMLFPRLLKTSGLSVQERKDSVTKDQVSTVLSPT